MQKTIAALICCVCFLAAWPVYAQNQNNNDIAQATVELQAYLNAAMQGDLEKAMEFATKNYRAQIEELIAAAPEMRKLSSQLLKRSSYNIISMQKLENTIVARVGGFNPDMDQVMEKAQAEIPEEIDVNDINTVFASIFNKACQILEKGEYETKPFEHNIYMLKENEKWRIDDED